MLTISLLNWRRLVAFVNLELNVNFWKQKLNVLIFTFFVVFAYREWMNGLSFTLRTLFFLLQRTHHVESYIALKWCSLKKFRTFFRGLLVILAAVSFIFTFHNILQLLLRAVWLILSFRFRGRCESTGWTICGCFVHERKRTPWV